MPDAQTDVSFDLGDAIDKWKQGLRGGEGIDREEVSELEDHLRGGLDRLCLAGLDEREAFVIAKSRVGSADRLETEFSRVHPGRVWRRRVMWMIAGYLLIHLWAMVTQSVLLPVLTNGVGLLGMRPALGYTILAGSLVIALGLMIVLLYRLGTRGTAASPRPWSWAGGVAVLVGVAAGYLLITALSAILEMQMSLLMTHGIFEQFLVPEPEWWTWDYLFWTWRPRLNHLIPLTLLALAGVLAWRGLSERRALG